MQKEWFYLFLSFDEKNGEKMRYKFVTDSIDLNLAGIVEFDKSLININHNSFSELMKQREEKRIREIKPISKELISDNEYFSLLVIYYILEYYHTLGRFSDETGYINPYRQDELLEHKELIKKLEERFRKKVQLKKLEDKTRVRD